MAKKKSLATILALYKKYGVKPLSLKIPKSKFKMPKFSKISFKGGKK